MDIKTIKKLHLAATQAETEADRRTWELYDAVFLYAQENPRSYAKEVATALGYHTSYVKRMKATVAAYPRGPLRNESASARVHMQYVASGRSGEWVPDGTTLTESGGRHQPKQSDEVVLEQVKQNPALRRKVIAQAVKDEPEQIARELVEKQPRSAETLEQNLKLARHGKLHEPHVVKAATAAVDEHVNEMLRAFHPLAVEFGVVGMLEAATERLREIAGEGALASDLIEKIEAAHAKFIAEFDVAKAMAGISY